MLKEGQTEDDKDAYDFYICFEKDRSAYYRQSHREVWDAPLFLQKPRTLSRAKFNIWFANLPDARHENLEQLWKKGFAIYIANKLRSFKRLYRQVMGGNAST